MSAAPRSESFSNRRQASALTRLEKDCPTTFFSVFSPPVGSSPFFRHRVSTIMAAAIPQYLWLFVCVSLGGNGGTGPASKSSSTLPARQGNSNQKTKHPSLSASSPPSASASARVSQWGGKEGAAVGGTRFPLADRRRHEAVKTAPISVRANRSARPRPARSFRHPLCNSG